LKQFVSLKSLDVETEKSKSDLGRSTVFSG